MSRVIDQKANRDGFPKAGELIEIRPQKELTLQDRRIFNLLIENAGPRLAEDGWHEIAIQKLRGGAQRHDSERVADSILRLMTTIVELPAEPINGLAAIQSTVLVSENIRTIKEDDPRSVLRYKFTETLRNIVHNSRYWGRLKAHVIMSFSSKYALALYEVICLRINLMKAEETVTVEEFRHLLDVPNGLYTRAPDLIRRVVKGAVLEVNALSDFNVEITPEREGGRVRGKLIGFRLRWERKSPADWRAVLDELGRSKVGRRARITGTVEDIEPVKFTLDEPSRERSGPPPTRLPGGRRILPALDGATFEKAREIAPGWDVYALERDWRRWMDGKPVPANPEAAFLGFCRTHAERNRL